MLCFCRWEHKKNPNLESPEEAVVGYHFQKNSLTQMLKVKNESNCGFSLLLSLKDLFCDCSCGVFHMSLITWICLTFLVLERGKSKHPVLGEKKQGSDQQTVHWCYCALSLRTWDVKEWTHSIWAKESCLLGFSSLWFLSFLYDLITGGGKYILP